MSLIRGDKFFSLSFMLFMDGLMTYVTAVDCTFRSSSCWSGRSYVFLFGLQHWISPHSQFFAELVLGKIRPSEFFSGVSETLGNPSLPTESISLWVFYICCLHWLYSPPPPCNRGVAAFSHVCPYNFPFKKNIFLLCFTSSISFSFL